MKKITATVAVIVLVGLWILAGMGWFMLKREQQTTFQSESSVTPDQALTAEANKDKEHNVLLFQHLKDYVFKEVYEILKHNSKEVEKSMGIYESRVLEVLEKTIRKEKDELRAMIRNTTQAIVSSLKEPAPSRESITSSAFKKDTNLVVKGFDLRALDYSEQGYHNIFTNSQECASWLQKTPLQSVSLNRVIHFHVFWVISSSLTQPPFTEAHSASLKSFFTSQDRSTARLNLWTNDPTLLRDELLLKPLLPYITVRQYRPGELAKGSIFEGNSMFSSPDRTLFLEAAKLLILYSEGGVWFDIDSFLNRDFTPLFWHSTGSYEGPKVKTPPGVYEGFAFNYQQKQPFDSWTDGTVLYLERKSNLTHVLLEELSKLIITANNYNNEVAKPKGKRESWNELFSRSLDKYKPELRKSLKIYPSCFVSEEQFHSDAENISSSSLPSPFIFVVHDQRSKDREVMVNFIEAKFLEFVQSAHATKTYPHAFDTEKSSRYKNKYISMSIYGETVNTHYLKGALKNAELASIVYPGWKLRVYVNKSMPEETKELLRRHDVEVKDAPNIGEGETTGMFWRFLIYDDPAVDAFIVRDTDSRLNLREQAAVREWLESDFGVHMMRDNSQHGVSMVQSNIPSPKGINEMGGMWGAKRGSIPITSMREEAHKWSEKAKKGSDQEFLWNIIYPLVKHSMLSHDSYFCTQFPNARPFPSQRRGQEFVGAPCDMNNYCGECSSASQKEAPLACRGKPEWLYG